MDSNNNLPASDQPQTPADLTSGQIVPTTPPPADQSGPLPSVINQATTPLPSLNQQVAALPAEPQLPAAQTGPDLGVPPQSVPLGSPEMVAAPASVQGGSIDLSTLSAPSSQATGLNETAPTDLSNLAAALGAPLEGSNNSQSSLQQPQSTVPVVSQGSPPLATTPPTAPASANNIVAPSGKKLPKWALMAAGAVGFLAVTAASAYFILGIGQTLPEPEVTQQPLTNPPRVVAPTTPPSPTASVNNPAASLGSLSGASPAAQATPSASPGGNIFERRVQQP